MKVMNTMTRELEEFVPEDPKKVRMYTCGPTVYNYAHIGNFRAYIFEDLLRRHLKYNGYEVTQVMNLTDVDDKTIRNANEVGVSLNDYTQPFKDAFFEDLGILNVEPAEHYPAATEHIPAMITLIEKLIERGHAYQSDDGSVYFRIDSFEPYGCLARLDKEGMKVGARVAQDEYDKENLADFALWKAWTAGDGDVAWDSPWGRGRPGWHIECSAMSMEFLGESFDLHTGGVDNMFPHHEDEIAQSECATGKTFVKYWMHCAHLVVNGKKMSKSDGNFFTLRDLLDKGYTGREIRYVLIAAHYAQQLNFTFDALSAARSSLRRLDDFNDRLFGCAGKSVAGENPEWCVKAAEGFKEALDRDLNISEALAALFEMVSDGNRALDAQELDAAGAAAVLDMLKRFDTVLGFLEGAPEDAAPAELLEKAHARDAARQAKDFSLADQLRDEISAAGWTVKDTAEGPQLSRI